MNSSSVGYGGGAGLDVIKFVTVYPLYIIAAIFLIIVILGIIVRLYVGYKYIDVTGTVTSQPYTKLGTKVIDIEYVIDGVEYYKTIPSSLNTYKIGQNINILVNPTDYYDIININDFYSSIIQVTFISIILFALAGGLSWMLSSA